MAETLSSETPIVTQVKAARAVASIVRVTHAYMYGSFSTRHIPLITVRYVVEGCIRTADDVLYHLQLCGAAGSFSTRVVWTSYLA